MGDKNPKKGKKPKKTAILPTVPVDQPEPELIPKKRKPQ